MRSLLLSVNIPLQLSVRFNCRVDPLYAFFIQWSPDIYGGEDEIDPTARGFIVIDEESEDFDFGHLSTPVEDHFKAHSMSKDWEVRSKAAAGAPVGFFGGAGDAPHTGADNFLISEATLNSLKSQLGEIPSVPLRVFNRISFKRKREDSTSSGTAPSEGGCTETATVKPTVGIKDWEVYIQKKIPRSIPCDAAQCM